MTSLLTHPRFQSLLQATSLFLAVVFLAGSANAAPLTEAKKLQAVLQKAGKNNQLRFPASYCGAPEKQSKVIDRNILDVKIQKSGPARMVKGAKQMDRTLQMAGWCKAKAAKGGKQFAAKFVLTAGFTFYLKNKELRLYRVNWPKKGFKVFPVKITGPTLAMAKPKPKPKPNSVPAKTKKGAATHASKPAKSAKPGKPTKASKPASKSNPPSKLKVASKNQDPLLQAATQSLRLLMLDQEVWMGRLAQTLAQDYAFRRTITDADARVLPVAAQEFAARLGVDEFLIVSDQGRAMVHIQRNLSPRGDPFFSGPLAPGQKLTAEYGGAKKALVLADRQSWLGYNPKMGLMVEVAEPIPGPVYTGILVLGGMLGDAAGQRMRAVFGSDVIILRSGRALYSSLKGHSLDLALSGFRALKKPRTMVPFNVEAGKTVYRAMLAPLGNDVQGLVLLR